MNTKKIVITGGPSTGKTSVINQLESQGYTCLHEVIRLMTLEKKEEEGELIFKTNPIVSVADPMEFNQRILDARIAQYKTADEATTEIVFFDRGIPDVLAYMDCFEQAYETSFENACRDHRYDMVFLLPPWREIYVSDSERFESYEEGLQVDACLLECYTRFGYDVKIVPKGTVDERVDFILKNLKTASDQ